MRFKLYERQRKIANIKDNKPNLHPEQLAVAADNSDGIKMYASYSWFKYDSVPRGTEGCCYYKLRPAARGWAISETDNSKVPKIDEGSTYTTCIFINYYASPIGTTNLRLCPHINVQIIFEGATGSPVEHGKVYRIILVPTEDREKIINLPMDLSLFKNVDAYSVIDNQEVMDLLVKHILNMIDIQTPYIDGLIESTIS